MAFEKSITGSLLSISEGPDRNTHGSNTKLNQSNEKKAGASKNQIRSLDDNRLSLP
jgi:hypothetical protein